MQGFIPIPCSMALSLFHGYVSVPCSMAMSPFHAPWLCLHSMQEDGNPKYRFESKAFPRIASLLKDHVENGTAVTRASGAILIRAISKYDKWSLRHNDVKVGRKIGKGAFGEVFEASLSSTGQRVAVKTCRSNELQDMDKFLQEAEILKQYTHPNIVCLIGVCAEKDPVYIVMELMLGGALLEYLRKKGGHQPQRKLCTMAIDACAGMEYLEKKNCIHRYTLFLTHSLTHSLSLSLTHSLTHSPTHPLIHSPTHPLTH